ncbi:MAG: hypothetical protein FJ144_03845 [Deltaproteobacteria bacterium]|nr:hypothetical protein [Deltaproteobacteria bacterium]
MAQEDTELLRELIKSIDKKLDWETLSSRDERVRITLRSHFGETVAEIPHAELEAAREDGVARNRLRERLKRARKRIVDAKPPYMPWRLPKIEPIGAPGPRQSWGGGGGRR